MPRTARVKDSEGIYHIMVRSISEVSLFRDSEDKNKYLFLIKKYQQIFRFKVYAYCLMSNHGHIEIDCCGADISKIMKSINQCYCSYFNKKYNRHGHLFQDRFKSKLICDDKYLISLSAYIHNNPKSMKRYKNNVKSYRYSSLGIYLGINNDNFDILDVNYILQYFGNVTSKARESYLAFINRLSDDDEATNIEFIIAHSESRNERKIIIRNFTTNDIVNYISKYTNTPFNLHIKFNHKNTELKSLCVLIMRSLCNFTFKQICTIMGNISASEVCRLCENAFTLVTTNSKYTNLIDNLIATYSVA